MTDPVLLSADRGGVRTLTLNRPHRRNAIDPELWVALRDALDAAGRDRGVRALVLTGAGGSFCSGADISVRDDVHPRDKLQRLTDVALALHELPAAGPPVALAQTKALLNEGADRTLRDALANEARAQVVNFATVDVPAAYAAFAEKREPSFTGQWALKKSEQSE
ncbi:enoyl-CoA hydratase/isomerase family protein [Mycobacterium sp. HUMS_1102779]|uniref:enoyl-CoA hydratase/isomerase family protein n=1 Tax=Mycobacterium sp. HUMS_1102779 TaxID=3383487 RepID=UPI00389980B5